MSRVTMGVRSATDRRARIGPPPGNEADMNANPIPTPGRVEGLRRRIDERLAALVPGESSHPERLHRSIRHSLLAPGKRIRPIFSIMVATQLGAEEAKSMDPACAIEMVHTASLILDDLPIMDDARLRRGRPANHRLFGEDTATLAAVALLNRSYGVITEAAGLASPLKVELMSLLCAAIGSDGIIAGQECDLHGDGNLRDTQNLVRIHGQKTGALFVAAAEAGARIAGARAQWVEAIREFARNLGLAFQIRDDVLDVRSTESAAGKDVSKDGHKATFASVMGVERAAELADRYVDLAAKALEPLGPTGKPFLDFAHWLPGDDPDVAFGYPREAAGTSR